VAATEPDRVRRLREKVERYLGELYAEAAQPGPDGASMIAKGSAVALIKAVELSGGRTGVIVFSITNMGVRVDDELTRFIATENGKLVFGVLHLEESESAVALSHTLLGEFLNREELNVAVAGVIAVADEYDDRIKARFGGRLAREAG
jgi:hypothetical protein